MTLQSALDRIVAAGFRHRDVHEIALGVMEGAFFTGGLFPTALLEDPPPWRRVFFPLKAATGMLRFAVPRWMPPFQPGMEFIGHSGISGVIAFACPARRRSIVGAINQLQERGRPYRVLMRAALACRKGAAIGPKDRCGQ
ncbi:hypothetical protein [Pararhodobacter sp. SW119]|uniref:hypothetical protein n=1 Tax=Pararhodobacter sp. SW119 TaxID=2780075 RepID=UPI001ADF842D|nr:hypothetical protein [Pararhodobacter sp. SW119]